MRILRTVVICASMSCAFLSAGAVAQNPGAGMPAAIQFNRDIRPILSDKCYTCHGPDKNQRKTEFRFDIEESAKQGLGGGRFAIVPGDPGNSVLIQRVSSDDDDWRMPPSHTSPKLSDREIALLTEWIRQGAQWEPHWAFVPPQRPQVPGVSNREWVRNPIDSFVIARLEREGLNPNAEADRATLVRRLTLDLTGLPPTPSEIDAFLADTSSNAYEKVVDRLLASPHYGERMALPWLDASRYADTNGYQLDRERSMWRWRDWVIESFNQNMPFDQFTKEQLAGDLLPRAGLNQRIATGFNRNHRINAEGGVIPEEYRNEYVVDRVGTTASVFMGVTLGCARCHDHKYDPFSQKDFYQMYAYFNNIPEPGKGRRSNSEPYIKAPTAAQQAELSKLEQRISSAAVRYAGFESEIVAAEERWLATLKGQQTQQWAPKTGLVAHVGFDSSVEATVKVEEGKPTPAATWDGSARYAAGRIGEAAEFDGVAVVQIPDVAAFEGDDAFTLSAWIYPTSATGAIVTKARDDNRGGEQGYGVYLRDSKLHLNVAARPDSSLRVNTAASIELNRWHHIVATYRGTREARDMAIYIDGQLQQLEVIYDNFNLESGTNEPLRIGSGSFAEDRFHGFIDDVRVYDRAVTSSEAAMIAVSRSLNELGEIPRSRRSKPELEKVRNAFLEFGAQQEIRDAFLELEAARLAKEAYEDAIPTVMVMDEMPIARKTTVLLRGAYDLPGEEVQPQIPTTFAANANFPKSRLGLAEWLVSPANPLTARVTVNRFWQMYFGVGIVKTLDDFGSQGEAPFHPELLDWLATEFMRNWDVKSFQKLLVMSATYRQASEASSAMLLRDPENRLLARGPRFRLNAETIRDQALAMAGLLVPQIGGPSVKPYQAEGLWAELNNDEKYVQDHGDNLYRRSIYTFWKRTIPPPTMANFDASSRESCVVMRGMTNSPLQALNLMNNVAFIEASRIIAERMMKEGGATLEDRIAFAFRLATGRRPAAREAEILASSFNYSLQRFASNADSAVKYLSVGEYVRDEGLPTSELAAYTAVASLILNLDETITKE